MRHSAITLSFILLLSGIVSLMAMENRRDFRYGLTSSQPAESMPKSKTAPQQAFRLSKKPANTVINCLGHNVWELKDGWELTEFDNLFGHYDALFSDTLDTKD